jgi:hypothetical protein
MRNNKILYWLSTVVVASAMLFAAFNYFTLQEMRTEFARLGFPDYFRIQLGVAKALGAIVLLLPAAPFFLKEFAYIGFAITYTSAVIAHIASGDPAFLTIKAIIILAVLIVSFIYYRRSKAVQLR